MVLGFGKNRDGGETEGSGSLRENRHKSATEEVERLASQGFSEQEIIGELRERGFSNENIKRSIDKVLKNKISSSRGEGDVARGREPDGDFGSSPEASQGMDQGRFVAPPPQGGSGTDFFKDSRQTDNRDVSEGGPVWEVTEGEEIELEVLIEEIVDEKLEEAESEIRGVVDDFTEVDDELEYLRERLVELEEIHKDVENSIQEEVEEVSARLENVEARMNSLEKAFKKFLPEMMEEGPLSPEKDDSNEIAGHGKKSGSRVASASIPGMDISGSQSQEKQEETEDEGTEDNIQ